MQKTLKPGIITIGRFK